MKVPDLESSMGILTQKRLTKFLHFYQQFFNNKNPFFNDFVWFFEKLRHHFHF